MKHARAARLHERIERRRRTPSDRIFPIDPWRIVERRFSPRAHPSARVDLRDLQRLPRPARRPRGGRARRTIPARCSTASTRRGRSSTPRTPTASHAPARRSSTPPTARSSGCSSTTSRSTLTSARILRYERVARHARRRSCAARSSGRRRAASASSCARDGWSRSSAATSRSMHYEVESLDETVHVAVSSELVTHEPLASSGRPARRARLHRQGAAPDGAAQASGTPRDAGAAHPSERAGAGVRDGPRARGAPTTSRSRPTRRATRRAASSCSPTLEPGAAAAAHQVRRLPLRPRSAARRPRRPRQPHARPRARRRPATPSSRPSAATSTEFWERSDVQIDGAAGAPAGRALRPLPA